MLQGSGDRRAPPSRLYLYAFRTFKLGVNKALGDHDDLRPTPTTSALTVSFCFPYAIDTQSNAPSRLMHACLNVDEIVRLIASKLIESKSNATAVALACCCKNFENPVLDVLWETQDKLLPLFKSLPGDVWNEDGCAVSVPITRVFSFLNCSV